MLAVSSTVTVHTCIHIMYMYACVYIITCMWQCDITTVYKYMYIRTYEYTMRLHLLSKTDEGQERSEFRALYVCIYLYRDPDQ